MSTIFTSVLQDVVESVKHFTLEKIRYMKNLGSQIYRKSLYSLLKWINYCMHFKFDRMDDVRGKWSDPKGATLLGFFLEVLIMLWNVLSFGNSSNSCFVNSPYSGGEISFTVCAWVCVCKGDRKTLLPVSINSCTLGVYWRVSRSTFLPSLSPRIAIHKWKKPSQVTSSCSHARLCLSVHECLCE